jgi:hypothetical protein
MRFYILLTALIVLSACTASPVMAGCFSPTPMVASHNEYFKVYKYDSVSISYTPDATGTATTAVMDLQFCSRNDDDNSCNDLDVDSDGDGVGDTNLFTGVAIELSGVKNMQGFRYLKISADVDPLGGEEPEFTLCTIK